MEIIKKDEHNDMCGGYSYYYEITFGKYGNTLKDVLKEIKEYSYKYSFAHLGNFGNPNVNITCRHWGIYVNGDIYISSWEGERSPKDAPSWATFYEGDESETVMSITGDGGWYCGINIYIKTYSKPHDYTNEEFLLDMPFSK